MTLMDLPGIVRSVGTSESQSLVDDFPSLIKEFLENERCIILAVHPCNVDFHNSQIMADAKKVDPRTQRTIPVLTKPDIIDKGGEGGVLDLLTGKKTKFERGFNMVLCRGQQALDDGVTVAEFLHKEQEFFRNHAPWKNTILQTKNIFFFGYLLSVPHLDYELKPAKSFLCDTSLAASNYTCTSELCHKGVCTECFRANHTRRRGGWTCQECKDFNIMDITAKNSNYPDTMQDYYMFRISRIPKITDDQLKVDLQEVTWNATLRHVRGVPSKDNIIKYKIANSQVSRHCRSRVIPDEYPCYVKVISPEMLRDAYCQNFQLSANIWEPGLQTFICIYNLARHV